MNVFAPTWECPTSKVAVGVFDGCTAATSP